MCPETSQARLPCRRAEEIFEENTQLRANRRGAYLRPGVLVVDEVGYEILERRGVNLVFQAISKQYEKGAIILTSNKTFSEWGAGVRR